MSATENSDGGTAFPAPYPGGVIHSPGMTLRDYFAAHAMVSLIRFGHRLEDDTLPKDALPNEIVASQAYGFADAMLLKRSEATT